MTRISKRSNHTPDKVRTPQQFTEAPDDQILLSQTALEVTIMDPDPGALVELSLQRHARSAEWKILNRFGDDGRRASRDLERKALRDEMRQKGISPEAIYVVFSYVYHQVDVFVKRKDLNRFLVSITNELATMPVQRAGYVHIEAHLTEVLHTPSPLLTKDDCAALVTARAAILRASAAELTIENLKQYIEEAYDRWPGDPFVDREKDLEYLSGRFVSDGKVRMLRRPSRRPRTDPWPSHVAAVAERLLREGLSARTAAQLTGRLFSLELLSTGLVPAEMAYSLTPPAIQVLLRRRRRSPHP